MLGVAIGIVIERTTPVHFGSRTRNGVVFSDLATSWPFVYPDSDTDTDFDTKEDLGWVHTLADTP
jgi:hypothetical protein